MDRFEEGPRDTTAQSVESTPFAQMDGSAASVDTPSDGVLLHARNEQSHEHLDGQARGFGATEPSGLPSSGDSSVATQARLAPSPAASTTVASLHPLSFPIISELCTVWFENYHPWFPILHQPSLLEAVQASPDLESCDRTLVIKAIAATTMCHCQSYPTTTANRQEWADAFRESVLLEALGDWSLRSIQALLILSLIDSGSGRVTKFWSIMAVCKRYAISSLSNITSQGGVDSLQNECSTGPAVYRHWRGRSFKLQQSHPFPLRTRDHHRYRSRGARSCVLDDRDTG